LDFLCIRQLHVVPTAGRFNDNSSFQIRMFKAANVF
jgi:hypothetical protein